MGKPTLAQSRDVLLSRSLSQGRRHGCEALRPTRARPQGQGTPLVLRKSPPRSGLAVASWDLSRPSTEQSPSVQGWKRKWCKRSISFVSSPRPHAHTTHSRLSILSFSSLPSSKRIASPCLRRKASSILRPLKASLDSRSPLPPVVSSLDLSFSHYHPPPLDDLLRPPFFLSQCSVYPHRRIDRTLPDTDRYTPFRR